MCVCIHVCQCRCSLACRNGMECADKRGLDTNKPRLRILSVHMTVLHLSSAYWFQKSTHVTGPLLINQLGCHFCLGHSIHLANPSLGIYLYITLALKGLFTLICQSKFGHNFRKKTLKSAKNLLIVGEIISEWY